MNAPAVTTLVIGLGNPLMGDEGVGWHIAESLEADPRLPPHVEAVAGGTDLLRFAARMKGCRHVMLVDAILDGIIPPGRLELVQDCFSGLEDRQGHVHSLSARQAIELLQAVTPELAGVRFTLALVAIASARLEPGLSRPMAAAVPGIIDRLLAELSREGSVERAIAPEPGAAPPMGPGGPAETPPEPGAPPFRTCGSCKRPWPTWQSFLLDPDVRLLGFQAVVAQPDLNLLVFEHRCGSSVSILTRRLRHLLPGYAERPPAVTLFGTEQCQGHCRFLRDLAVCDAPCANAHDRQLALLILRIKQGAASPNGTLGGLL